MDDVNNLWRTEEDEAYHMEVNSGRDILEEDPRGDAGDFVGSVAYWAMHAEQHGEEAYLPSELTKEEVMRVTMILSEEEEEEKRRWACYDVSLAKSLQQQRRPPTPPQHAWDDCGTTRMHRLLRPTRCRLQLRQCHRSCRGRGRHRCTSSSTRTSRPQR
jgi:hypothetical protein